MLAASSIARPICGCFAIALVAGCLDEPLMFPRDAAAGDAAVSADRLPPGDLASPLDQLLLDEAAAADLAANDLASPADLSGFDGGCSMWNGELPQAAPLFGVAVTVQLAVDASSVAVGDVTGDGLPDVVVGGYPDNFMGNALLLVLPQLAGGKLGAPVPYDLGFLRAEYPLMVATGDLNGDGLADVAVTRSSDVAVLFQNGAGSLAPPMALAPTQAGNGEELLAIADLDGDGHLDLAATGWAAPGVDVWLQAAQGLSPPTSYPCTHSGYDAISVGDLDGDGASDLLISSQQSFDACALLQRPGGFAGLNLPLGRAAAGVAMGDLDADCLADFVFTTGGNAPDSHLAFVRQIGAGNFAAPVLAASKDIPGQAQVIDVDGDGRRDVVVNHEVWSAVGVYRQLANGQLAAEELYKFPSVGFGPGRLLVADVNDDGLPDLIGADFTLDIAYHL